MKIVTIHQPEHLPWLGFFDKMSKAHAYILLDNVQFKTNNWQNRNRIVDRNGAVQWLTVPCLTKNHTQTTISDILINDSTDWRSKYKGRIKEAYRRYPFYEQYAADVFSIIDSPFRNIVDLNIALITYLRTILGIGPQPELIRASDIGKEGSATDLLVYLIKQLGGDAYIAGADGGKYMDLSRFADKGIALLTHQYHAYSYSAPNGNQACMSVLDALFAISASEIMRLEAMHNKDSVTQDDLDQYQSKPEELTCTAKQ